MGPVQSNPPIDSSKCHDMLRATARPPLQRNAVWFSSNQRNIMMKNMKHRQNQGWTHEDPEDDDCFICGLDLLQFSQLKTCPNNIDSQYTRCCEMQILAAWHIAFNLKKVAILSFVLGGKGEVWEGTEMIVWYQCHHCVCFHTLAWVCRILSRPFWEGRMEQSLFGIMTC